MSIICRSFLDGKRKQKQKLVQHAEQRVEQQVNRKRNRQHAERRVEQQTNRKAQIVRWTIALSGPKRSVDNQQHAEQHVEHLTSKIS